LARLDPKASHGPPVRLGHFFIFFDHQKFGKRISEPKPVLLSRRHPRRRRQTRQKLCQRRDMPIISALADRRKRHGAGGVENFLGRMPVRKRDGRSRDPDRRANPSCRRFALPQKFFFVRQSVVSIGIASSSSLPICVTCASASPSSRSRCGACVPSAGAPSPALPLH
jgi:hypothetical protein